VHNNNNNNNNNNDNNLQSAVMLLTELYVVVPSKEFWPYKKVANLTYSCQLAMYVMVKTVWDVKGRRGSWQMSPKL